MNACGDVCIWFYEMSFIYSIALEPSKTIFLFLVKGRFNLTGASLHILLRSISTICVYKHGQILYALNPLAIIHEKCMSAQKIERKSCVESKAATSCMQVRLTRSQLDRL